MAGRDSPPPSEPDSEVDMNKGFYLHPMFYVLLVVLVIYRWAASINQESEEDLDSSFLDCELENFEFPKQGLESDSGI
jgi:hypothetical protein